MGSSGSKASRIVKYGIVGFLCFLLALIVGYLLYVLLTYSRIEDHQTLEVEHGASEETIREGTTYSILSNNFGFGAYQPDFSFFMDGGTESWAKSKESVLESVRMACDLYDTYQPDILVLQEIDTDSTRSYHVDQSRLFREHLAAYDSVFACNYHSAFLMYPFTQPHGSSNSGLQTFSRFPITSSVRYSLPVADSFSKFLDLDRCFSVSRIPVDNGKELIVVNVHTSAYGNSGSLREEQMSKLFGAMEEEYRKGNYVLCGGDFNHDFTGTSVYDFNGILPEDNDMSWGQPFPSELIPEHFSRCLDYAEGKDRASCRNCDKPFMEDSFLITLDGFIVSDNISVEYLENVWTGFAYSDHNPVYMQFSLTPVAEP